MTHIFQISSGADRIRERVYAGYMFADAIRSYSLLFYGGTQPSQIQQHARGIFQQVHDGF
jgi:hypothetical protein